MSDRDEYERVVVRAGTDGVTTGMRRGWVDRSDDGEPGKGKTPEALRPTRTLIIAASALAALAGEMPMMRTEHSGHPRHGRNVDVMPRPARVGRNEACPCQSGKKFKACCLRGKGVPNA